MFDIAVPYQLSFQDPATPIMNGIIDLHHTIFFFLLIILIPVLYIFSKILATGNTLWLNPTKEHVNSWRKEYLVISQLVHGTLLEIIWTITPAIILMFIALPSFALLYSLDEVLDASYTFKVTGNQWFWHYETPFGDEFDSYMKKDLTTGYFRLLEADNVLMVPTLVYLRFIITSADVLHSFAVPSLGIKVDAVPGRLNSASTYIQRQGFFTGQCSELCGVDHAFMPINIVAVREKAFLL
jgi:cytochrome c oxidase subunit 2